MGRRPNLNARADILARLIAAAEAGAPCPRNTDLTTDTGSVSGPVKVIQDLERDGIIKVQRFQAGRIVTILASGKSTATPKNMTPHWRAKGRQPAPSVNKSTIVRPSLSATEDSGRTANSLVAMLEARTRAFHPQTRRVEAQPLAPVGPAPRSCRFIESNIRPYPAEPFCGAPVQPGSSWCPEHHERCFQKKPVALDPPAVNDKTGRMFR